MQTARRLVKGPDTAETSERHLAEEDVVVRHISDHQRHLSTAILEVGISMKDMESRGKRFGFLWSAFCSQQGDHHLGCVSKEGLNPSPYDLHLERPQVDALPYHNQLINAPLQGSPTGTFNWSLHPHKGGDSHAPLAAEQPCHPHSGPWHGEMVYLTFTDNIDYPANRTGPYDQGDPPFKLRLIRHHKEHSIFVISCDPLYLHTQDDKPKQISTFST